MSKQNHGSKDAQSSEMKIEHVRQSDNGALGLFWIELSSQKFNLVYCKTLRMCRRAHDGHMAAFTEASICLC